jgi:hypothetical protein
MGENLDEPCVEREESLIERGFGRAVTNGEAMTMPGQASITLCFDLLRPVLQRTLEKQFLLAHCWEFLLALRRLPLRSHTSEDIHAVLEGRNNRGHHCGYI